MREYPVRKTLWKRANREFLEEVMEQTLGPTALEGEWLISSRYPITEVRAKYERRGKKVFLLVSTRRDGDAPDEEFMEALRAFNEFVFRATGYTAKERRKLLMKGTS